jgi:hypothetical protein
MHCKVIAGMLLAATPVHAQQIIGWVSGNDLHRWCQPADNALCVGYATAIADVLNSGTVVNGSQACIPSDASRGQLAAVTKKYLEDYPETRHFLGAQLVADAFAKAFPCKGE